MLKSKSFLCIDFGATTVKVAEFEPNETGSLRLKNYTLRSMGEAAAAEGDREAVVLQTLKDVLSEGVQGPFKAGVINVCAPGFQVFSKFVKLPATDPGKVGQIIQYEAQQNVPFPLEEVVWDYQILGTAPSGELEVLLVAIKNEVVETFFRIGEQAGLELRLVDVSSAALCNAYRFNYGDAEGCVMLLDIGARSSNLLFFESGRVYSRSINIGANSITQDFANEVKMKWDEAEKMKIEEGFVSLGGAYEEPSNPHQALISKIARQVMTRLHIQMNQTIQFYRGQQGGSMPTRLYLAGGASLLPYTAQFFAEKLSLPVDYFNPFRNIQIDPAINLEEMARVAHQFGEVVGLGIRNLAQCPVELNLMPASHLKQQQFKAKRIYFIGSVLCVLVTLLAFGWFFGWTANQKRAALTEIKGKMGPLKKNSEALKKATMELGKTKELGRQYVDLVSSRARWSELLAGVQAILISASTNHGIKLSASDAGGTNNEVLAAVWIEKLESTAMAAGPATGRKRGGGGPPAGDDGMGGMAPGAGAVPMGGLPMGMGAPGGAPAANAGPRQIGALNLTCRALNLKRFSPSANREFVESLQTNFQAATNLFLAEGTTLTNRVEEVELTNHTFGFSVTLQLKEAIRF
ncbi:MAG: type IV pilus assembly protein PilM [Proteobacteria bacterium]|nr:type IV pilus assembly protein PilM [Pseudomonadota bacterium]